MGLSEMDLDEEDPSEDWVSQSIGTTGFMPHTPNGPLGSENYMGKSGTPSPVGPLSPALSMTAMPVPAPSTNGHGRGSANGRGPSGSGSAGHSQGIQIKKPKKKTKDIAGSPLTNSVQENFRGFTYSGGESVIAPVGMIGKKKDEDEESMADEEAPEVTTEDEIEDPGKSMGRYANSRRKGLAFTGLDDE